MICKQSWQEKKFFSGWYLDTDHIGFQLSGWTEAGQGLSQEQSKMTAWIRGISIFKPKHLQSLIDRQIFFCVTNRPFGVIMLQKKLEKLQLSSTKTKRITKEIWLRGVYVIPGGLNGYSGGNLILP